LANNNKKSGWLRNVLLWTFFLSLFFNSVSQTLLQGLGVFGSLLLLLLIIAVGVVFDIIGVAATAAKLPPLNARNAKKIPGARQALDMAQNSDHVATFCSDVVGDISGIVSGSAAAGIVASIANNPTQQNYSNVLILAVVASLTVGGKGLGKTLAINYSTEILTGAGKVILFFQGLLPNKWGKGRK